MEGEERMAGEEPRMQEEEKKEANGKIAL